MNAFGHREYVPVRVLQHATFICVGSKTSCFIVAQQAPPPNRVTDRPKGKEQRYFHGVFPEASAKRTFADVESDSSGDDICVMQKSKVKKF